MKIEVLDTASASLSAMADRLGSMKPLMVMVGNHMENSVRRNFNQGGRPEAWAPLANVTVLAKGTRRGKGSTQRIQGKQRLGGPLVFTGNLRSSIGFTAEDADLVLWAAPDPAIKGPVHQFGTDHAGRNHDVAIPARPYLVFQQEDIVWFRKALLGWIRVGSGGVRE